MLGILVINIQSYAMVEAAFFNPTAYGDLTGANYVVWLLSHVLAEQKFMTILAMLFGAGILIMTERTESRGARSVGLHYRHMGWLILFGVVHAHLLWYGDFLFQYGLCGLIIYPIRRLAPGWLLVLGLTGYAVVSLLIVLMGWSLQFLPVDIAELIEQPMAESINAELAAYRGSWVDQMSQRVPSALWGEVLVFPTFGLVGGSGLMLVGMALYKMGIFSGTRSSWLFLAMIALALSVGIPTILYGVHRNFELNWDFRYSLFFGIQFNFWGCTIVSMGWVGLMMLACRTSVSARLKRLLAAVGQMALTNYLVQTIVCTTIFYGHGLGLFGKVDRVGQIAIVFAVWVLALVQSSFWLRYFRFGPFEWLWRSLTYCRFQPFKRSASG